MTDQIGHADLRESLLGPCRAPKPPRGKAITIHRDNVKELCDVLEGYIEMGAHNVGHFIRDRSDTQCWEAMCRRCQTDTRARALLDVLTNTSTKPERRTTWQS
jgi:hypothetical protein